MLLVVPSQFRTLQLAKILLNMAAGFMLLLQPSPSQETRSQIIPPLLEVRFMLLALS